jgi:hypothetical protein
MYSTLGRNTKVVGKNMPVGMGKERSLGLKKKKWKELNR